jgi:hypothetical protein
MIIYNNSITEELEEEGPRAREKSIYAWQIKASQPAAGLVMHVDGSPHLSIEPMHDACISTIMEHLNYASSTH